MFFSEFLCIPNQQMQMLPATLTTEHGQNPQGVHVLTSLQKNTTERVCVKKIINQKFTL